MSTSHPSGREEEKVGVGWIGNILRKPSQGKWCHPPPLPKKLPKVEKRNASRNWTTGLRVKKKCNGLASKCMETPNWWGVVSQHGWEVVNVGSDTSLSSILHYILTQASKEGLKEVLRASQRFNTKNDLDIKKIALYLWSKTVRTPELAVHLSPSLLALVPSLGHEIQDTSASPALAAVYFFQTHWLNWHFLICFWAFHIHCYLDKMRLNWRKSPEEVVWAQNPLNFLVWAYPVSESVEWSYSVLVCYVLHSGKSLQKRFYSCVVQCHYFHTRKTPHLQVQELLWRSIPFHTRPEAKKSRWLLCHVEAAYCHYPTWPNSPECPVAYECEHQGNFAFCCHLRPAQGRNHNKGKPWKNVRSINRNV